jgi:hypothetical protein
MLIVIAKDENIRFKAAMLGDGRYVVRCAQGHRGQVAEQMVDVVAYHPARCAKEVTTCLHAEKSTLLSAVFGPWSPGVMPGGP